MAMNVTYVRPTFDRVVYGEARNNVRWAQLSVIQYQLYNFCSLC